MLPDITLILDRLLCRMFGHLPGDALDSILSTQPWYRARCRRCGTRLSRTT